MIVKIHANDDPIETAEFKYTLNQTRRCCTARSKSLTSLRRSESHPAQ